MKSKILIVSEGNACRSQMAEGFINKYGGDQVEVFSAGSRPLSEIDPMAIQVMKEVGIDIAGQKPKDFFGLPHKEFDYVITIGCSDVCPFYPTKQKIDWAIEKPKESLTEYHNVRNQIQEKAKYFSQCFCQL
ncbi:MAG: arsenate reductase ArsC [Candidatus Margulisbacteria bacterium]|nr:arsenate reductase ArsC [Candidatus Margulisiibacteriota bacterium]